MKQLFFTLSQVQAVVLFWCPLIFATTMAFLPNPNIGVSLPGDKVMHFLAFFYLTTLCGLLYPRWATPVRLFLTMLLYGALIEAIQYFIPNRMFSVADMLADALGVVVALIVIELIRFGMVKKRQSQS